jgi:hypothetical protein
MRDLTNVQKHTCVAIINIFETGEVSGDYSNITSVEGDPGGLTYGKSQTTLMSGNLHSLIESYCFTPGVKFADKLRPYLPQLKNRDRSLNHDETLHHQMQVIRRPSPHSLGKLIEWKLAPNCRPRQVYICPHSLGKLIEWKPSRQHRAQTQNIVPTRWGN